MERNVIFRDRQEVTPEDLNNVGGWAQDSDDHIVVDGIEPSRRFVGFVVTQSSAVTINVGAGRLYFDGRRHFRDDPDGVPIDLNSLRPNLQKKIVAVVVWPETIETSVEQRHFLVDAENLTYEPDSVAMERRRQARIEAIGGAEGVSPQAPVIDATAVVVALITMDAAGIVSIVRNTAAELRNLSRVADDVEVLKVFRDDTAPQVSTLKSDLARLAAQNQNSGDKELLLTTASDIALIKSRLDLPDTYVAYRGLPFLTEAASDPAYGGYAARIEEGLRFPYAAQASTPLALLNPNAPNIKLSPGGVLLPAYTELERRITKGDNGNLSLAEYSNLESRELTKITMSRARIRYGADFDVSTGSAFWNAGTYQDRLNLGIRSVFEKAGETFQVYETGRVDADGHKIVRLSRFWEDAVASPYWSRLPTTETILGYAHVETFLNPQDGWITALGPHMKGKPAAGTLTMGICETDRGQPNLDRILAMTTVNAADVKLVGDPGNPPKFPIEPTFLEGGTRYGYFVVTQHAFVVAVADAQDATSQGATGTYFYGLNGGNWFADPTVHLVWRDWRASFPTPRVDVDLTGLQLAGGIQAIDILADAVAPGSTDLVWSVQIGGFWKELGHADPQLLEGLLALLPLRATFVGTPDVMPGLRLTGSVAKVTRLAAAAKHATTAKATASTSTIVVKARLRDFDGAHHTIVPKIDRAGVIETHDALTTVVQSDGVVEKTWTFNLAAATVSYRSILELTTDSVLRPFAVVEEIEIAL